MGCTEQEFEGEEDDLALQDFRNDNTLDYLGKADQTVDKYNREQSPQGDMFQVVQETGGQQFMATKPWIGALVAPSDPPQFIRGPPQNGLELYFVNGYRTQDSRSNLYFLNSQTIIYPAACLGIKQDIKSKKQSFYGGGLAKQNRKHKDDIISLALSPDKKLVATGSLGARPLVLIWDSQTLETKNSFKLDRNTRCVSVMCFSKDGKFLFLGDKANEHNVYLYDIDGNKKCETKTGSDNLNDCAASTQGFGTVSKDGFLFFQATQQLKKKRGLSNGNDLSAMACVSCFDDKFYCGDIKGKLIVFSRNSCQKAIKAHQRALMAIGVFQDCIITSGSDNKVKIFSKQLQNIKQFSISTYCKAIDKHGNHILLGSRYGEILLIDKQDKQEKVNRIMKTHWTGQTWGLSKCPNTGLIITAGDDNTVMAFNISDYSVVSTAQISSISGKRKRIGGASTLSLLPPNQQSRSIAISKKSGNVALGTNVGGLSIRKSAKQLGQVVYQNLKLARQWIQVMKYSPQGDKLAVGSHDNNIYILNQTYQTIAKCSKHNSFITNLDWSVDGTKIQSNCGAYQYLFYNAQTGNQQPSGASICKDQEWNTYSVKLGWWVQGIFPGSKSGNFVNSCIRSNNKKLIMTGDDYGQVNLFNNPALKGARCNSYKAHSSHVVRAQFNQSDSEVYSVGGFDKCLIIWKMK